jgi:hypothetical protein
LLMSDHPRIRNRRTDSPRIAYGSAHAHASRPRHLAAIGVLVPTPPTSRDDATLGTRMCTLCPAWCIRAFATGSQAAARSTPQGSRVHRSVPTPRVTTAAELPSVNSTPVQIILTPTRAQRALSTFWRERAPARAASAAGQNVCAAVSNQDVRIPPLRGVCVNPRRLYVLRILM